MQKLFLLSIALLAVGAVAQAQVSIIPKGGLTYSTIAFQAAETFIADKESVQSVTGLTSGIGFNIPFVKNGAFSVQPELLYVQKGYRATIANWAGNADARIRFNYLEVPVLGQFALGTEKFKFYVNAGPSFAYGLGGQHEVLSNAGALSSTREGRIIFRKRPDIVAGNDEYYDPKYFNRFDVGVQFGGGVGLSTGPGILLLDVRYGLGLNHFYKGGNTDYNYPVTITDPDPNIKNRMFSLTLGYAIALSGQ
jgi:hypothetical protein